MTDHLLVDIKDRVASITFNRPEARNAVSIEMRTAFIDAILALEHDDRVRCVVLQGAGKHFMAGGDVKSFKSLAEESSAERASHFEKRIHIIQPLLIAMRRMQKPVVSVVQGFAAGFGFSLAMASDLVVASHDARFAMSYIGLAASPDGSATYYLPRLVGVKRAMEIALLGEPVDVQKAYEMGLVNRIAEEGQLQETADAIIQRLANGPTIGYGNIKRLMYASSENSLTDQMSLEAECFAECAATDDWVEGVMAFNEKRKAVYKGK